MVLSRHLIYCTQMNSRVDEVAAMPGRIAKNSAGVFVPMHQARHGRKGKGKGKGQD